MVNDLFLQHPIEQITCATIGILEVISVLVRKQNDGRLSSPLYSQAIADLNENILANEAFSLTAVDDNLIISSLDLIALHNINATDAIILRSCLNLQNILQEENHHLILCCCDKRLLRAAKQENIEVLDPEVNTQAELSKLLSL